MSDLLIDSAIKALIPPLQRREVEALEANLIADGCREPLAVWQESGAILDGHNRYAICKRRGIKFEVNEMSFAEPRAAYAWVIRNQLGRRNLTNAQRTALAIKLESYRTAGAKENQKRGGNAAGVGRQKSGNPVVVDREIAKVANVSHDTVSKVARVLERGDDETKEAMLNGSLSINKAAQSVPPTKNHANRRAKADWDRANKFIGPISGIPGICKKVEADAIRSDERLLRLWKEECKRAIAALKHLLKRL